MPSPTLASHTKGVQFAHSPAFSPPTSPSHKASTLGLGARMKHFASLRSRSQRDDKPPSSFVGGQTLAPRFTVVCGGMRGFVVGSGTEWWGWERQDEWMDSPSTHKSPLRDWRRFAGTACTLSAHCAYSDEALLFPGRKILAEKFDFSLA
ncbi:hypothetical protein B0H19DRAFT_1277588 [Mycena capillaripes]|nr:hypothetical protein B0H19DRAFT_1277588 [Mycena capillaripes]